MANLLLADDTLTVGRAQGFEAVECWSKPVELKELRALVACAIGGGHPTQPNHD